MSTPFSGEPAQIPFNGQTVQVWSGSQGNNVPVLLYNQDQNNTVSVGYQNNLAVNASNGVPLGPQSSVTMDGSRTLYANAPNDTKALVVIPGGSSFFQRLVSLTLPTGATSGERIVLNGALGAILVYNTAGVLIGAISPADGNDGTYNYHNGVGVYQGNGLPYVVMSTNYQGLLGIFFPSNRPMEQTPSEINLQIDSQGLPGEFLINNISGPIATSQPDFVVIGLCSSAADNSRFAAAFHEYHDIHGNSYEVIILDNTGIALEYVNTLTAQLPGAVLPTDETWHTMAPLQTGFNVTGNNFNGEATYAEYTYEPIGPKGSVHLRGNINVTAGPGAAFKEVTTMIGAGYRPTQPRYFSVSFTEAAILSGSNNSMGMGVLEPNGGLWVYGGASVAADNCLVFDAVIRLD